MASRSTSRFPGFDHLFWASQAFSNDDFVAELDLEGVTQVDALRGAVTLKKAVARWAMGASRPSDAVWTQDVGLPLLRSSAIRGLSGITGWSSSSVELYCAAGRRFDYAWITVNGRCGPLLPERSIGAIKAFPAKTAAVRRGLFFEASTWDGSDVFMPSDDSAFVFVTDRAKKVLSEIGGFAFIGLEDVEQLVVPDGSATA